ncbi:MAG: type II toxin-antitoxin system VapC family toxin [bacterium]|nr:type II toxin-antitoxin system VapC family toxin [bacterium]
MPSSWVCVDASLVIGLVAHPHRERLRALWKGWQEQRAHVAAPALLLYEVTNAIYQYEKRSLINGSSADRFLRLACALPVELFGESDLHVQALRFSRRFSLPATYDAHYLALADHLGGELWTTDRRLVKAVESDLEWVHLAARTSS